MVVSYLAWSKTIYIALGCPVGGDETYSSFFPNGLAVIVSCERLQVPCYKWVLGSE